MYLVKSTSSILRLNVIRDAKFTVNGRLFQTSITRSPRTVFNSVDFSKNKINTNLVDYQEQNEQEHLKLQQFCPTKNTLKIKSLNLQTYTE